jgi:two-component system OmpR family sensor kinase
MRRLHPHWHHHRHHLRYHDGRTPFPWDRVMAEARRREPGWRRRIRNELRLHYGAHLHSRLAHWFGAAIFLTVITTLCAAHMGRAWLASHPWRAVVLFGIPALLLWRAAGRIARRISRPLYELTRVAQRIGAGELSARASTHRGYDEIDVLATTFNDMAARLERQLTEQRELLAAVSHELRTPLARIRLLVEIARQAAAGPAPDPETLNEIEREAIEIDTLVGELLASARLEFQAFSPKPIDAVEMARRALERAGEPAAKLAEHPPAIRFPGDPTLVARALANLIDNARKHGGGLDRLAVRTRAGTVVFEITDRGPGFEPGEEARIFDRFYRGQGDGSQAHHGSLGLGLSGVPRSAAAPGGVATAANRPTGGAVLTLEFPTEGPAGVT